MYTEAETGAATGGRVELLRVTAPPLGMVVFKWRP